MKIKIKGGTYLKTTSLYDRTESSENEVSSDNNVYSSEESSYQNSTEQIRMKSGDSSEISANGAVYNYNSEERLVEFSLASLKNNTEDCTGSLKIICWVSQYRYNSDNGGFQNENYRLLSEYVIGWLNPGEEKDGINCKFNISEDLKSMLDDMDEWHFIFTINESHVDGNDYILTHFNTNNQTIGALLKIDDDSIVITTDSEDPDLFEFIVYRDGIEYSGRLESTNGKFRIGLEDGRTTYVITYHDNGEMACFASVDINDNVEFIITEENYYNNFGVEISEVQFNQYFKSLVEETALDGFKDLHSRIQDLPDSVDKKGNNEIATYREKINSLVYDEKIEEAINLGRECRQRFNNASLNTEKDLRLMIEINSKIIGLLNEYKWRTSYDEIKNIQKDTLSLLISIEASDPSESSDLLSQQPQTKALKALKAFINAKKLITEGKEIYEIERSLRRGAQMGNKDAQYYCNVLHFTYGY